MHVNQEMKKDEINEEKMKWCEQRNKVSIHSQKGLEVARIASELRRHSSGAILPIE